MKKLMIVNGCMFVCGWVLLVKFIVFGVCVICVLFGVVYSLGLVLVLV